MVALIRLRLAIVGASCVTALVVIAVPAGAHGSITPTEARAGEPTALTFRVPNERSNGATIQVILELPSGHPIPTVTAEAPAGWQVTIETTRLPAPIPTPTGEVREVASRVVWTGGQITGNEVGFFPISTGPLPGDTETLVFRIGQTYASGEIVAWSELPSPGGPEPKYPAPTLRVVGGSSANTTTTTSPTGAISPDEQASETRPAEDGDAGSGGRTLTVLGVGVLLGGALVGMARWRRKERHRR